ncbi:MAG: hypothetical protein ACWGPS_06160 [Candidatus Promineifilaceae bacterium]
MSENIESYRVVDLPPGRRLMINTLDLGEPKHCMYGLLEVGVTAARRLIAQQKVRADKLLSCAGYFAFRPARAVVEDRVVPACMRGSKRLVL